MVHDGGAVTTILANDTKCMLANLVREQFKYRVIAKESLSDPRQTFVTIFPYLQSWIIFELHSFFLAPQTPTLKVFLYSVSIFNGPNIMLNTNSIFGQAVAKNLPATIFRSRSDDHFLWGNVNKRHTTRDRQCRCYKQKLVQQWTFDPHSLVPLKWHQASWIQKALWCKESKQFENYNQTV